MLVLAAVTVDVETKMETEAEAELEPSVTEDDSDMTCLTERIYQRKRKEPPTHC